MDYASFNPNDHFITDLPPIPTDNITIPSDDNDNTSHQHTKQLKKNKHNKHNKHVSFDDNLISAYIRQDEQIIPPSTSNFSFFNDLFPYIFSIFIVLFCIYYKHF